MMQGTTQFSSQLPATRVWGYGGGYLGPTIEARTGQPVTVTWINNLPTLAPACAVHRSHARRRGAGPGRAGDYASPRRTRGSRQRRRTRQLVRAGPAGDVLVSERPERGDALVPRPRDGDH